MSRLHGARTRPVRRARPAMTRFSLAVAILFAPALPAATIVVSTLADSDAADGACSLREAIVAANDDAAHQGCPAGDGEDRIEFSVAGAIVLGADLPVIEKSLTLAGPPVSPLAVTINGGNHRLLELDGSPDGRTLKVEHLVLRNGLHPTGGGCIKVHEGDRLEVSDSRIASCESLVEGGAIYGKYAASMTLLRTTIVNSISAGGAGGIYFLGEGSPAASASPALGLEPTATFRMEECTVNGNEALDGGGGGGLAVVFVQGEIRRSTVSGNRSEYAAGGVWAIFGTLLVDGATITANSADTDFDDSEEMGAGLYVSGEPGNPMTVEVRNSVVGNNFGGALPSDVFVTASAAILSQGYNLIGVRDGADAFFPIGAPNANDDWIGSRSSPVLAGLGPLAENGGFTQTHEPSPGSLLVDHGDCPGDLRDQRGFGDPATNRRPVDQPLIPDSADGCDIGAFESGAVELAPVLFVDGFESGGTGAWSG